MGRGEAVTQIAHWRHYRRLGYGAIADRLHIDLDRYRVAPGAARSTPGEVVLVTQAGPRAAHPQVDVRRVQRPAADQTRLPGGQRT
ncbi:hypothetical protein FRACA_1490004 [Frankia canadensis]|uniref:Uncharacterized protein n=1 Tax=Frankia canadensis TaxID=1836972 RepID=A0A2I2KLS4_9ACTN|nr:hypothetical protein FRACA_1490004 [Frankia canadensis]SOU53902.1 hypothetical protein FRACA_1490004 [Frankia canadensis]